MRVAIIGDHPDGLAMADALFAAGNRQVLVYAGPSAGADFLERQGHRVEVLRDIEEVLARPDVDLVLVADALPHRPEVLRRAVQSDKHVLSVHPADLVPDIAYEVAMIQQDTRKLLLPMLADRLAPGLVRLRQLAGEQRIGKLQVVECEYRLPLSANGTAAGWEHSPLVRVWDSLRCVGGEIQEVSALAAGSEEPRPIDPLTLTGRFQQGALLQVFLAPNAETERGKFVLRGDRGEAELSWTASLFGPTTTRHGSGSEQAEETLPESDRWQALAEVVQGYLEGKPQPLSWLDETRSLELFDAARRSLKRRKVVSLLYEEFSETGNFKSAMASLGCGLLLLVVLLVFFVAPWVPKDWAGWFLYPVLALLLVFLGMQFLRWIVPAEKPRG